MRTIIIAVVLMLVLPSLAPVGAASRGTTPSTRSITPETTSGISAQPRIPSPGDNKILIPAIKEYRVELSKARIKMERFDLSKGRDLVVITDTKVSIPAMKEIVKEMVKRAKGIADPKLKGKVIAHIKNLSDLLKSQEDNRTDKDGMANAFNEMEKILNQMGNPSQ